MRRELNKIEYFNWCIGQPYNMVISAQVRGDLQPDQLRAALDKAQRRHPLLGVKTQLGPAGLPWFSSEGVGLIPLAVVNQAEPDRARMLSERELTSTFTRDDPEAPRLPLVRVSLFLPRDPAQPADVVLTVQHIIADGLSMVFLLRDLLHFMEEPDAPVAVLDAPANGAEVLPARALGRIPGSLLLLRFALWLARVYAWLRPLRRAVPPELRSPHHLCWELTQDQTSRLRARCRRERVSVQSAICAAFLSGFSAIHTPVNLRAFLARPVGESIGLYVGSADIRMKYQAARGLWGNARRFHRRLRGKLRDPFWIFRLFSKAVPPRMIQQLGSLLVSLTAHQRPFAVTNLGQLDGNGIQLQTPSLKIESLSGGVTGIIHSSVLTVYTMGGRMRLHVLANESSPPATEIRDEVDRSVRRLLGAIDG